MAYATGLAMLVTFGFNYTGARDVARATDAETIRKLIGIVITARVFLALITALISLVAMFTVPIFQEHPEYLWLAWMMVLAIGFNPFWYFQGTERFLLPSVMNIVSRALATTLIFILVNDPDDGWMVLALQGCVWLTATIINNLVMILRAGLHVPSLSEVWSRMRESWNLFLFGTASAYNMALCTFILGFFAPPAQVSYFGGSERLVNAGRAFVIPLVGALFPRISGLLAQDRDQASRIARKALVILGSLGLLMAAFVLIFAPSIVGIILGDAYSQAVPILRILSVIFILNALNKVLGMSWMIPLGYDRYISATVISAVALNVFLSVTLAPAIGVYGVTAAAVASESAIVALMMVKLLSAKSMLR
jgi:PST family polysaccharide transporter